MLILLNSSGLFSCSGSFSLYEKMYLLLEDFGFKINSSFGDFPLPKGKWNYELLLACPAPLRLPVIHSFSAQAETLR